MRSSLALMTAAVTAAALVLQFSVVHSHEQGWFAAAWILLGYFTILTNILLVVTLSAARWVSDNGFGRFFGLPSVQSGVAVYIAVVGFVYHLVLRPELDPQGLQLLCDIILHYITPVLYLCYWWLVVPKGRLRWWHALVWLSLPLVYLVVALVRGAQTGSYPYPFLDVPAIGMTTVLFNSAGIAAIFLCLGLFTVAADRWMGRSAVPSNL